MKELIQSKGNFRRPKIFIVIKKIVFNIREINEDISSIVLDSNDSVPMLTNFNKIMEVIGVLISIVHPLKLGTKGHFVYYRGHGAKFDAKGQRKQHQRLQNC